MESPPYPSLADAFYIGLYPCAYVTLVLLIRARVTQVTTSQWLDGAIGALAAAAVAASAALGAIVAGNEGDVVTVATNLAYPLGDLILLSLVIGVFGVCRWRPGGAWLFLGLGLVAMAITDGIYLFQTREGDLCRGHAARCGLACRGAADRPRRVAARDGARAGGARGAPHDPRADHLRSAGPGGARLPGPGHATRRSATWSRWRRCCS